MNSEQMIQQIQRDAQQRIAAIRAAESALAAAVAANAKSEAQRAEDEQRQAEIAAALATWEAETLPAIVAQMTEFAVDFDEHRATIAQVEELLKSIPATHNELGKRFAAILHQATAARLALPDATAKNRARLADELKEALTGGRQWGAGLSESLRDYYARRQIHLYALGLFNHREEK